MFVFQAAGNEEKIGVVINKHPNEFIKGAPPDKVEVITFDAKSTQAKEINSAEASVASAREEVVAMVKQLPPSEQKAAGAALEKFDKAAAGHNISMMNFIASHGSVTEPSGVVEKLNDATHELRSAVGGDPTAGYDPVGKLADATNNRTAAVLNACASVTVMTGEHGRQAANEKLAEQKKVGSSKIEYERLPKAGTSDAIGPAQPANYKIGGTLNSSDLENMQRNYKPVVQPALQQQNTQKKIGQS